MNKHVFALALLASLPAGALAQPVFIHVGALSGLGDTKAQGVNLNGTAMAGIGSTTPYTDKQAIRWTPDGGVQNLGLLPGCNRAVATAISDDGSIVVGACVTPEPSDAPTIAFRWTSQTGMQPLTTLPEQSYAWGITPDGSTIVGEFGKFSTFRAFRWTQGTRIQDLGTLPGWSFSSAYGVSADGKVVVGRCHDFGNFKARAFRWTEAQGMQDLGVLPNTTLSSAVDANADGSVIIGASYELNGYGRAFRWTAAGGMQDLGSLLPNGYVTASSITDDGSMITGFSQTSSLTYEAFIWTQRDGMRNLNDYVIELGADLQGLTLGSARVSSNGSAIAGGIVTGTNAGSAYVIRNLPPSGGTCYADCDASGSLTIDDFICFQTLFALGDPVADCDGDAALTIDDFICFQTVFALGC